MPSGSGGRPGGDRVCICAAAGLDCVQGHRRLIYFGVNVGDRVKEGQLIARIEHDDMDALYRQALARLGVARAQLGAAKPELEEATLEFRAG